MTKTEQAVKLRAAGYNNDQIAKMIGSTPSSVGGLLWYADRRARREADRMPDEQVGRIIRQITRRVRTVDALLMNATKLAPGSPDWWKARGF